MLKNCLIMFTVLGATACATDKDDAKGVVDESQPPATPSELGKADASSKEIAVDVQSAHPYTNNLNKLYSVPYTNLPSCANQVRVHFKVLRTEATYDTVTVEPTGAPIQSFDGSSDDTWTAWFAKSGSKVNVRLETDNSVTFHGFEIDKLEWNGGVVCPAIAYPACSSGQVDITPPTAVCSCPSARVCATESTVEITHGTSRGFNLQVHAVHGNVASETHPGPTDAPVTTAFGTISQTKIDALVKRASDLGMLRGPGYTRTIPATGTREELTVKAGAFTVTFVANEGTHDAAVAQLIADFEALFSCGASTSPLTCGSGFSCDSATSSCIAAASCICPAIYQPVCGQSGHTFSNACEANCASAPIAHTGECGTVGDSCGTIFGLSCQGDEKCRFGASQFSYPFPDAGGRCVGATYCDAPADCTGLVHIAVPGAWACNANACAWTAGIPWKAVTNGTFETAHPYASSTSVWKEVSLPAGAQAMRLVTATGFALEANYDFLEVWSWTNGAWKLDHRYTGTTGPAATDEFAGQYHYLRFISDSSVNKAGFRVDAQYR